MRMLGLLLIIAVIVIPLLVLLVLFRTEIADWTSTMSEKEVRSPLAHHTIQCCYCTRVCPAVWARTEERALECALANGYQSVPPIPSPPYKSMMLWEDQTAQPEVGSPPYYACPDCSGRPY